MNCHRLLSIVINSRSNFQALPYLVWQIVWKIFSNLYHIVLSCFRNIPCSCWCSIQVSLQSVIATVNTKCQECLKILLKIFITWIVILTASQSYVITTTENHSFKQWPLSSTVPCNCWHNGLFRCWSIGKIYCLIVLTKLFMAITDKLYTWHLPFEWCTKRFIALVQNVAGTLTC